jgi:transposase InsO family protein
MKVFGLQGSVYRFARVASRLTAESSAIAAVGRDALQRFDRARRDGLTAVQAARAVGVPRSTLYRWRAQIEPRSRRPHRFRPKSWPSDLVRAVERLRLDFPMWGRAKIGPLARAEGLSASDRTVGRIIATWSSGASSSPCRRSAAGPAPIAGARAVIMPCGCPKASSPIGRAASSRSTPCSSPWRPAYDLHTSVEALNPVLDSFKHLYNHHRLHGALAGLTPAAYLAQRQAAEIASSHMCRHRT